MENTPARFIGLLSRRNLLLLAAACLLVGACAFLVALHIIGSDVRATCREATDEFGGDCVSGLISYVQSGHHSFRERNQAIWALGEIGDPRALPALRELLDGDLIGTPCDVSTGICRYSVEKAISLCEGINVLRWMWRWI